MIPAFRRRACHFGELSDGEGMGDYSAWAASSQKVGIGNRLKGWVENTYLSLIEQAGCSSGSLLEIGPGNGEFALAAQRRGFSYAAVERSPVLTESLRARGIDCRLANFPADRQGLEQFDCVYASHVLEHQDTREEAVRFVEGVHGVLKPRGFCVINCPNVLSHKSLFWASDYTHNFVTTPLRVRNLLLDHGFEIALEQPMRFGFCNPVARAAVAVAGLLVHPTLFVPVVRLAIRNYASDPRIYFRENFTLVARKL
ncbi:MAG: class I SAM-dependent methyltransferase [Porphyrobacter sp.]|nr:class I SAM-dependent methyltransferase [Porphyrobacter sp.]